MSERLNSQNLIDLLVNHHGLERKEAENFIKEFFSLIEEGLERDKFVKIKGLGTFKLIDVESRESVDVNTGERIEIQGHTKISFIPEPALRDIINKPFAHFETVILNDDVELDDTAEDIPEPEDAAEPEEPEIAEEHKEEHQVVENVPEEVIADPQEVIVSTPPKEDTNKQILTLVIILTVLICGIVLFLIYQSDLFPEKKQPPTIVPLVKNEVVNVTDTIPADSTKKPVTVVEDIAKEPVAPPVIDNTGRRNTVRFSQIPVNPDSTSYIITGTRTRHTVKEGETLIRIIYRYYKSKDLWPYLLMHNRAVIKNPNVLPPGMTLDIPELEKK
jgi:nucleoid DNA-binding protein/nucleoid-associated protein YgaU